VEVGTVSDKIEPLEYAGDEIAACANCDCSHPWVVCVHAFTRAEFAALVRWGAAALARTHPARAKRAEPCAHNITNANADVEVCAGCGEVLRGGAVPTDAEGAE
jgi:hypothetical protein